MLKRLFPLLLLTLLPCLAHASLEDDWFDPAFLEANTLQGGTGFIDVPSPEVIPGAVVSASIHRYQVKLDYGLFDRLELGLTANVDGYDLKRDNVRKILYYGRLRLLDSEHDGIGLSVGADSVGGEDLGWEALGFIPDSSLVSLQRYYVVAGGVLPFYQSMMITAGWSAGALPSGPLLNVSEVVFPGLLAMLEYDGQGTNLGARFLLSPRVKLDVFLYHTQDIDESQPFARIFERNIFFGITYSEPWPARSGQD